MPTLASNNLTKINYGKMSSDLEKSNPVSILISCKLILKTLLKDSCSGL